MTPSKLAAAPEGLEVMIRSSWAHDPSSRPRFSELLHALQDMQLAWAQQRFAALRPREPSASHSVSCSHLLNVDRSARRRVRSNSMSKTVAVEMIDLDPSIGDARTPRSQAKESPRSNTEPAPDSSTESDTTSTRPATKSSSRDAPDSSAEATSHSHTIASDRPAASGTDARAQELLDMLADTAPPSSSFSRRPSHRLVRKASASMRRLWNARERASSQSNE